MTRVMQVLTVPDSLRFIDDVVRRASERGFETTVVTAPGDELWSFGARLGVRVSGVEMARRVTPIEDVGALGQLIRLMRQERPHLVHAHTPKGGLLGTLAARACGIPHRFYQMRGLAHVTATGLTRTILIATESISCSAATRVICQSRSLRARAVADGIVAPERAEVVLQGSNGVDTRGRYAPELHAERGKELRASLGIGAADVVFAFVGRLVRDKGVPELLEAFERVSGRPGTWLVVAGQLEERDPVPAGVRERLARHPRIKLLGHVAEPAPVYAAADVVVLPSHREGFPNVPLEAAAMALPVIATRVSGCVDAVVDGETGTLIDVGDALALAEAMCTYHDRPELRRAHGAAGRARAIRDFDRARIAEAIVERYERAVGSRRDR